uniref:Transmembrane serine protease 15 n=1 Tax=Scleropages formosus TaxID=113540 RepID=A0A8C9RVS8_SCLFO
MLGQLVTMVPQFLGCGFELRSVCSLQVLFLCCHGFTPGALISRGCDGAVAGAVFTEELLNKSTVQFKALAFDVENMVYDVFAEIVSLNSSRGSVVVTFDLVFSGTVQVKEVQEELVDGIQAGVGSAHGGLVIDTHSIHITAQPTSTTQPVSTVQSTSTGSFFIAATCPTDQMVCGDSSECIPIVEFCDGMVDCPDGADEDEQLCATVCDGRFLLLGPSGTFHSKNFPLPYDEDTICRWVIRYHEGLVIQITFMSFETEEDIDVLKLYEGIGGKKNLTYVLSGDSARKVLLLSSEVTAEFSSNFINNFGGFNATYSVEDINTLSNEEKVNCSFEEDLCFWRQNHDDDGDWLWLSGPSFPLFTGPSFDHTLGNQSGHYIVTPGSPFQRERSFRIHSLPLAHASESMCLSFWYHMYGEDVWGLRVLAERTTGVTVIFQKEGNYGDQWNYGETTLNHTVVFEARKKGGVKNDIALDDIGLERGPCVGGVHPEPTLIPGPTTPPILPRDCGGPFELWEPNSTFSSPHYPSAYSNDISCVWTLHAAKGKNIQLHFLDFDVEATFDTVEVRDGVGEGSTLLGVFTGSNLLIEDLFSTTNEMTVLLLTDDSGYRRGFRANFSSGFGLGQPEPCAAGLFQCLSGSCVANTSLCNGHPDCADASDEAECVQLQVRGSWHSVCSENWIPELSSFLCGYLGYRSVDCVCVCARAHTVCVCVNNCSGGEVISIECNNSQETRVRGAEEGEIQDNVRIVGGSDVQEGAWPWVVSLHWKGQHVCGASLIGREWLLTAAHCLYGKNLHLSWWTAVVGLHSQSGVNSPHVQKVQVDRIVFNKHYNKRTKDSDVAMMHLVKKLNFTDFVQPICLPKSGQHFVEGTRCFIAGWGRLYEEGESILQQASLPLIGRSQCQSLLPEYNITTRMVCAGLPQGGVDSCQGDSGGPLMCYHGNSWLLVGVTSFGVGCGQPQRPGVYALVSQFVDWVAETRRSVSRDVR